MGVSAEPARRLGPRTSGPALAKMDGCEFDSFLCRGITAFALVCRSGAEKIRLLLLLEAERTGVRTLRLEIAQYCREPERGHPGRNRLDTFETPAEHHSDSSSHFGLQGRARHSVRADWHNETSF